MRSLPTRLWLSLLLSSLLQILSFPVAGPLPLWRAAIGWIALVPFLYALLSTDKNSRPLSLGQGALLGYCCGIGWYLGNCAWIYQTMYLYGGLPKWISFFILFLFSLYLGLYHALFAAIVVAIRNSSLGIRGALLLSPFAWVAVELARARITGFPWDLLGYNQIDNLLLTRLAPLAGVMGLSFVIAAINAAFTARVLSPGRSRNVILAVALVLAIALQLSARLPALKAADHPPADKFAVMMQENLLVGAQGREVKPLTSTQEYEQFTQATLHPVRPVGKGDQPGQTTPNPKPDAIIWPEAPSHFESSEPYFRHIMSQLAQATGAPLIIGSLGVDFDNSSPRGYFLYDSASLFDHTGTYRGRYDKIHLVPWGEYIPFQRFFAFAHKLTEGAGDMDRGHDRSVFRTDGHTYGVFICYESIFGDEVREFVKNGADVLVNISDDGWYGDTGAPWQHLNMARMRAIENHRWILRSTNTGITTAIDPRGRIDLEAPRHVRAAFVLPFAFTSETTFYTRHGDWFAYLCALVTLAALAFSLRRKMN